MPIYPGTNVEQLVPGGSVGTWGPPLNDALVAIGNNVVTGGRRSQRVWSLEKDFGGIGNDAFDNSPAFIAAFAAMSAGDILTLGAGIFRTSTPVTPTRARITIQGVGAPWWPYNATGNAATEPCAIRPASNFTGSAVLWGRDEELNSGVPVHSCTIKDITIDGNTFGTNLPGVLLEGEVKGWKFDNVCFMQATGHNFECRSYASLRGTVFPRGGYFDHCSSWSAGPSTGTTQWGYYFNNYTDAVVHNCLAVSNQAGGFYIRNPGQLTFSDCFSVFNKGEQGFYVTGSTSTAVSGGGNGGLTMQNCFTDRNQKDGLLIDLYGPRSRVIVNGGDYRRDGANSETGGSGYAAIALRGSAANPVCPVHISAVTTAVEDDDNNNQVWTPEIGIYADYFDELSINGGYYWGSTTALSASNPAREDALRIDDEVSLFFTGAPTGAKARTYPNSARGNERVIPLYSASTAWAVPSAQTEFLGGTTRRLSVDLRRMHYCRISRGMSAAAAAGSTINIQFTTDLTGATGWTDLSPTVNADAANYAVSSVGSIPSAARTDVLLRIVGQGGNGTTSGTFQTVYLHVRP